MRGAFPTWKPSIPFDLRSGASRGFKLDWIGMQRIFRRRQECIVNNQAGGRKKDALLLVCRRAEKLLQAHRSPHGVVGGRRGALTD